MYVRKNQALKKISHHGEQLVQASLLQKQKQGIRRGTRKSKASITVQMFSESLKAAGRAAVALPQRQCPAKTRSKAPFMKDALSEEVFHESLSFPCDFM